MPHQYEAPANDLGAIRAIVEEFGFCLIKNALSAAELETLLTGMRSASRAAGGQPLSDLLGLPDVRHIYFNPRLLEIARALLGPRLVYDGEGTMNFEESIGAYTLDPYTLLHCDAKGRPGDIEGIWRSPSDEIYRAYRFGIYFQDYSRASGSLKVIVGSHRGDPALYEGPRLKSGSLANRMLGTHRIDYPETRYPLQNIPNRPGDVVIWNLRTFYSAGAKLFAADPSLAVHPDVEADIARAAPELFAPPPGPRNAVFFDYAAPAEDIDLYIKWRARPTSTQTIASGFNRKSDDPSALRLAAEHGIEVRLDTLITALAIGLATQGSPSPTPKLEDKMIPAVRQRLHGLLASHRDYSPHFPLFDRGRFLNAANPDAAVNGAVGDIIAALKAGKAASRPT